MKKKPAGKKTSTRKLSLHEVIISALEDLKAQNIVTLDVTSLTDVTDALVIASGSSNRQVRALAEHAAEEAKKNGMAAMGIEGLEAGDWVLVDFGDIVLHVMQPETREFYDLERLWRAPDIAPVISETKPATKKAAVKKTPASDSTAPVEEAYETQGAKARARKSPPKPATSKPAAAGKTATKAGTAKAGVYAKTGTRKPAAAKTGASKPAAKKPAAKKPAAAAGKTTTAKSAAGKKPTTRAAIGISPASKPKKPAARKPRTP